MRSQIRKRELKKRKNFLPLLILTILLWIITGLFIYFVDPQTYFAIPLFFLLLFSVLLTTFSIIFTSAKKGTVPALAILFFLTLRYFGVGNIINLLLIAGVAIAAEIYLAKNS